MLASIPFSFPCVSQFVSCFCRNFYGRHAHARVPVTDSHCPIRLTGVVVVFKSFPYYILSEILRCHFLSSDAYLLGTLQPPTQ